MRDLTDELLRSKVHKALFGDAAAGAPPPTIGRLVVTAQLGAGAMGTVFAAYDPRLDRQVAVKLLRGGSAGTNTRLLAEARALGKLAHPNVVAVHDAHEEDGAVHVIMELAPGVTLRAWLAEARGWREIARVLGQVGEGLAAAHAAGLVHRDVKPDNVVIGPDRARLVDFGLAEAVGAEGALAGTPRYMAPELLAGAAAGPASDQFSFGVTLHEALYGTLPDAEHAKHAARAERAERTGPPAKLPAWLVALTRRALERDPARRFPSMDALVRELGRDRRRRRGLVIAAVGVLALGVLGGVIARRARTPADPCAGGAAQREAAWPVARAADLRGALGDAPWAPKAIGELDRLAGAWETSHRRICEATRRHHTQPEADLELRTRCLDRRLARLAALARALGGPLDPRARDQVTAAIASLPRPEPCETLTARAAFALPEDPAARAEVLAAERDIDAIWATYALGRYQEARTAAATLEARTGSLDFAPLRAPLLLLLGSIEARTGDAGAARRHLDGALAAAAVAEAPDLELEIWARLLRGELFAGNPAQVIEWAPFARAAAARAGREGAELDGIVAEAHRGQGALAQARVLLDRALASADELRGDQRAILLMNLGALDLAAGRSSVADGRFAEARAVAEEALGAGHPELALYLDKRAAAALARGRTAEALALNEQSLALRRAAFGPDDRSIATSLFHRAETYLEAGRLARALEDLTQARAIRARISGATSARLGELDAALADVAAARGDHAAARALRARADGLDPRRLSVPPADVLSVDGATAAAARIAALAAAGDRATALAEATHLAARLAAVGPDVDATLAGPVADALAAAGDRPAAAAAYATALAALPDEPGTTRLRATVGLARTLDGPPAAAAARTALALLDALPELDQGPRAGLAARARAPR